MRARKHWEIILGITVALTYFSATPAAPQDRSPPPAEDRPDLANLHPFHRAIYLSGGRGAEWLWQANRPDGLFLPGQVTALALVMEEDSYLHQVGAALALARAARVAGNDRHATRARQALLTLLTSTKTDKEGAVRFVLFPSTQVNRVAAASFLILAIHELPEPEKDLLEQSEQLCNYLRKQLQPDGSVLVLDDTADPKGEAAMSPVARAELASYPGLALTALLRSQSLRPAPWKLEAAHKGLTYYRSEWEKHQTMTAVPTLTGAFTEGYLLTKDKAFAEAVFAMNDWLCRLQIVNDARRPLQQGGFLSTQDGKIVARTPDVGSARYAESLIDAARCARQAADVGRFPLYRESAERCLQFVTTLQYTTANTRHFADWYQAQLTGGFHASHQDGDLRLDHTQQAVCALMHHVQHVANFTPPPGRGPAQP